MASVLHINEKGGRFGGTEEYLALLTAGLARAGVRSHLACGIVGGSTPPELSSVHVIEGLASRSAVAGTAAAVVALVEQLEPDVIYLHNVFDPTVVAAVAGIEGRGTLLWYVHDHYVTCLTELRWRRDVGSCSARLGVSCLDRIANGQCVGRHPPRRLDINDVGRRTALSAALPLVDAVIVVSDYMRSLLADANTGIGDRLHHLERPVRRLDAPAARERHAVDDPVVVVYAGRINAEKGLDVVLGALARSRSSAPLQLRIAGIVEEQTYWEACQTLIDVATAARPNLTIEVLGHLGYQAMDDELRRADVVVVPSQWPEPLGAVAAESMAAGAAVIASDIGGLGELVADGVNGLLVAPADVGAWAQALDRLTDDADDRLRMGRHGHEDMARRTVDRHIGDLARLTAAARN